MVIYIFLFILFTLGFLVFPDLNSDSLYMEVFQSSFLRDLGQGDIWLQMPASAYFPDQLIYFISRKVLSINQSLFMVAISKIFLLSISIFYFCKSIFKISNFKALLIGLIVPSIFIPLYKIQVLSLYRIEFNHFAPVILSLIFFPILLKPKNRNYLFIYLLLFFGSFLSSISTVITLVVIFSITLSIFLEDFKFKNFNNELFLQNNLTRMIFVIYAGLLTGYITYSKYINPNYFGKRTFVQNQSLNFLRNIVNWPYKYLYMYFIVFLIIIICSIAFKKISNLNPEILKINRLTIRAIIIATFCYLILGVLDNQGFYRYFYPFIIIYFVNLVYAISLVKNLFKYTKYLFAIALIIPNFKNYDKDFIKNFRKTNINSSTISNCINSSINIKDSYQRVGIGIQDYWDSNLNSVKILSKKIDLVQLLPDGSPTLWMQNLATSRSKYNDFYLLIKKNQKFLLPFDLRIHKICEDPEFIIYSLGNETNYFIEYYRNLSEFHWSMLTNTKKKKIFMGAQLFSNSESLRHDRMLLSKNSGYAHYGPYSNLKPGNYKAEIFYSFINNVKNNIPDIEVGCVSKNNIFKRINSKKLIEGKGIKQSLIFNTSETDNCKLGYEVRTFINDGQKIYINYLVIDE